MSLSKRVSRLWILAKASRQTAELENNESWNIRFYASGLAHNMPYAVETW